MKTSDLATIVAGGVLTFIAVQLLLKMRAAKAAAPAVSQSAAILIANSALPSQPGWGWQYFTDGTSIDPQGNYWLNGAMVWKAAQG